MVCVYRLNFARKHFTVFNSGREVVKGHIYSNSDDVPIYSVDKKKATLLQHFSVLIEFRTFLKN